MMKKVQKRAMSLLLAMGMLISVIPVSAAGPEDGAEEIRTVQTGEMEGAPDSGMQTLAGGSDVTGSYTTWQSAAVLPMGQTAEFTLSQYNSSYTAEQIWFKVTVEEDNQAIQMALTDVASNIYVYVYDSATLQSEGPTSNYEQRFTVYGNEEVSWKADHAGVYYLMLRPYLSGNVSTTPYHLTCSLVDSDLNENNDAWQTATELTQNVNTYYNLNGSNDVDWFKITTTVPGQAIKLTFSNFDYTVSRINARVYSGADLAAGTTNQVLVEKENFSTDGTLSCKASEPGDYYVKIYPYYSKQFVTKDLKLRFELLAGDENENNDSYAAATTLLDDIDAVFNLNAANDEDWFQFETTKEEELVYFYFDGFDTDYSNRITYYIYDATDNGYSSSAVSDADINYDHTKALTFANVGKHYIRVKLNGSVPVENDLTLRISRGVSDDGEPNDTWQQATPLAEGVTRAYTLPATSDVDYFVFTVDKPNQTVKITFYNPVTAIRYYLYSGAELNASGSSAGYLTSSGTSVMPSGTRVMRYMLTDPGTYYLKLYANSAFTEEATLTYELLPPDDNERNNSWTTATVLNEKVATAYTMPATNDVDYFSFTTTEPNQTVKLSLYNPVTGLRCRIYSKSDYEAEGDNAGYLYYTGTSAMSDGTREIRYMLSAADTYYVRMGTDKSFDTDATITYELLPPDANERNNSWTTATALTEGIAMPYTLPATNDVDYFSFNTTEPNQTVKLTFNNPVYGLRCWIYSKSNYETQGNSADYLYYTGVSAMPSGTREIRYMLTGVDTYYVRVETLTAFDTDATITYELIPPDAYERNNAWDLATGLSAQEPVYLTLPAYNDYDWFAIDGVTTGDKVTVTVGDLPSFSGTLYCYLYALPEGETTAESQGYERIYSSDGPVHSCTFTVKSNDRHFIQLYVSNGNIGRPVYLKYTITGDSIPVSGVSIQTDDVTIFEGKTLQLTAKITPSNASNQNVTWASDSQGVATVDQNGKVTAVTPGTATITATTADGGKQATIQINVAKAIPVTGVTLTAPGNTEGDGTQGSPKPLALGSTIQMTASVTPDNATEQEVTWSVAGAEGVLSVNQYGLVCAVGGGTAKVVATTVDGNHTAEYWFNVPYESQPVRGVSLDRSTATLYLGESGLKLTAAVSPSYADNQDVTWESDNPDVAAVDQQGNVTPKSVGYATITVKTAENSFTAQCLISVQPERTRVQGISFESPGVNVGLYASVTLKPVFTPADATDQTVTWESSNKAVATVSRTGEVTAIGLGTATITATSNDGGYQATITVTVALTAGYGDVNNDGTVDAADALIVLQASVGLRALTDVQLEVADVNDDGFVDAADAILILRYNAGLIDTFPVESK